MNVTQFLARLSRGPLSNLSMSNDGDGTIAETKHPKMVDYLNEALLKLYARFDLLEKELILELDETVTNYKLRSAYAVSTALANPTNPHYIQDSVDNPFVDDLLKVLRVYTTSQTDLPLQLALNDDNHPKSVFTPQHDILQVPDPVAGVPLYIMYQASHPVLSGDGDGYLDAEIIVPTILEPALISYASYLTYSHMNGQEHAAKAAEHLGAYEGLCAEILDRDMVNSSLASTNLKFHDRGFI